MSYDYKTQRAELFTEYGTETLIAIRDEARRLLLVSGAFTAEHAMRKATGDSWTMLAALDYMVERHELRRVTGENSTWGQHAVFTGPKP